MALSAGEIDFETIDAQLGEDDDPRLWRFALALILHEFLALVDSRAWPAPTAEVGRCSHWLRPHQARWTAGGGFAAPLGYGSGTGWLSRRSLPQFDWSIILRFAGGRWEPTRRSSIQHPIRIAIPSRTRRHAQAAVNTLWLIGQEKVGVPYGFREESEGWICTASGNREARRHEL